MSYFDHPDGEECFQKLWICLKVSGAFGLTAATYNSLMITHTKGYSPTIANYCRVTFPFVAAGATYAAVTCCSTRLRRKDGYLNHFIGGLAAGTVVGAYVGSFKIGFPVSIAFGVAAAVNKHFNIKGYEWMPNVIRQVGTFDHVKGDYTWTAERE